MSLSWPSWSWAVIVYWAHVRQISFYIHKSLDQGMPDLDFMEWSQHYPLRWRLLCKTRGLVLMLWRDLAFGLFPLQKCYIFNIDLCSSFPGCTNDVDYEPDYHYLLKKQMITLWSLLPWFLPQEWYEESHIKCSTHTNLNVCVSKRMENNGFSLFISSEETAVCPPPLLRGEEGKTKTKKTLLLLWERKEKIPDSDPNLWECKYIFPRAR